MNKETISFIRAEDKDFSNGVTGHLAFKVSEGQTPVRLVFLLDWEVQAGLPLGIFETLCARVEVLEAEGNLGAQPTFSIPPGPATCPHCNRHEIAPDWPTPITCDSQKVRIQCTHCGTCGPFAIGPSVAFSLWNKLPRAHAVQPKSKDKR